MNGTAAEANGGDSSAGGSPVALRDVDLGGEREGDAATTSSPSASAAGAHSHGIISHESYFGARWGAFKRKALIRRVASAPADTSSNNSKDSENGLKASDSLDSPASGTKEVTMKKVSPKPFSRRSLSPLPRAPALTAEARRRADNVKLAGSFLSSFS